MVEGLGVIVVIGFAFFGGVFSLHHLFLALVFGWVASNAVTNYVAIKVCFNIMRVFPICRDRFLPFEYVSSTIDRSVDQRLRD